MSKVREPLTVAAVDLGSNSFHMVIGRFVERELQVVDRVREPVMLADGLDKRNRLTEEAQQRALACLLKMGERLEGVPSGRVRAVATNTLRRARNAGEFRARAQDVLARPIEIISGQEEARLIFLGVAHDRFSPAPRLLADIGGGSTEIILGQGYQVLRSHSLFMGCVRYSREYFPDGVLRKDAFRRAEIAAQLELRAIEREIRTMGWELATGSSGTIHAVQEILRANGWSDGPITRAGLKGLRRAMLEAGSVDQLGLVGLKPERAPVLPGGLAILRAIFKRFDIDAMRASAGALREGVLHDLVGRIRHDDIRDHTIRGMVERYQVDLGQATRVERTGLKLLAQLEGEPELRADQTTKLLVWASQLHEIGLAVAHTGFHKHGAYLIQHSYMPGFSEGDQSMLAAIVRWHRRKLPRSMFSKRASPATRTVTRLCVLFRLAVLLHRSRVRQQTPRIAIDERWSRIDLRFPAGWLETHPLTRADIEREGSYLGSVGIKLVVEDERLAGKPAAADAVASEDA